MSDFPVSASHRVVTAKQVRFRLLLADLEASQFSAVRLARRTTIEESDEAITLRKMLAAAENCASSRQLSGRLGRRLDHGGSRGHCPVLYLRRGDRILIDAAVSGQAPFSGRACVDAALSVNGKRREVVPIFVDIVHAARTRSRHRPGVGGRRARAQGTHPRPRQREDRRHWVARVEAMGETQQDGKIGQLIRVRNLESNRIVNGRVEASGIVSVDIDFSGRAAPHLGGG